MKNVKRILSLILVCCMAMSMFVFAESTEEELERKMSDMQKQELIANLGIVVENGSGYITRGEFANVLCKTFNLEGGLLNSALPYGDVGKDSPYYSSVSALYDLKVISASALFNPSNNIKRDEAVKMVISCLGYDELAVAKGGYPTGYLMTAKSFNLNDLAAGEQYVTKKEMPSIVYEVLMAPTNKLASVEIDANGVSGFSYVKGESVLKTYYKTDMVYGKLDRNEVTSTTSPDGIRKGFISVNNVTMELNSVMADSSAPFDCIGLNVEVYVRNIQGSKEVIYLRPYDVNKVVINASDVENYNNFVLTTYENDEVVEYKLKKSFSVIYNGKFYKDFKASDFIFKDGYIELYENDNNAGYDLVKIVHKDYVIKHSFDSDGYLSDVNGNTDAQVDFSDDKNVYSYHYYDAQGNKFYCQKSDLESYTSFEITKSKKIEGKGQYITIGGFTNELNSKISAVFDESVEIDGNEYIKTAYYDKYFKTIDNNAEFTIYLTPDNKVIGLVKDSEVLRYAYFFRLAKEKGYEGEYKLYVLDYFNKKNTYYFANNVVIDGESVKVNFDNPENTLTKKLSKNYQLIKYKLNDEGKVEIIDTASDKVVKGKEMFEVAGRDERDTLTINYQGNISRQTVSSKICFPPVFVPRSTKTFVIPESLKSNPSTYVFNKDDFYTRTAQELESASNVDLYDLTRNGDAGALIITGTGSASDIPTIGPDNSDRYIVDRIVQGVSEEGLPTRKITLAQYETDSYITLYFSSILNKKFDDEKWEIVPGDIVAIAYTGNTLTNLIVEYSIKTKWLTDGSQSINANYDPSSKCRESVTSAYYYNIGPLYNVEDNVLVMYDEKDDQIRNFYLPKYGSLNTPRFNSVTKSADYVNIYDLKGAIDSSWEDADLVVVRTRYGHPFEICAYER